MPVLQPSEYDASYFDGGQQALRHNAGYTSYKRWRRLNGEGSTGEFYRDMATRLAQANALRTKDVLEIGCAKGFIVEDLRNLSVNAFGLDVSTYAIGEATPEVAPFLTVGDARTALRGYQTSEWDLVLSHRFLECIDDADLPALVAELNRISRTQIHIVDDVPERLDTRFYNLKSLAEWQALDWDSLTRIVSHVTADEVVK